MGRDKFSWNVDQLGREFINILTSNLDQFLTPFWDINLAHIFWVNFRHFLSILDPILAIRFYENFCLPIQGGRRGGEKSINFVNFGPRKPIFAI
jgi:hypothetical protein